MTTAASLGALAVLLALLWRALGGDERDTTPVARTGTPVAPPEARDAVSLTAVPAEVALAAAGAEEEPAPVARTEVDRPITAELRVVDARTGEPVPAVTIAISGLKRSTDLVTDAAGRATVTEPLPGEKVTARVSDAGVELAVLQRDWNGQGVLAWTLAVPIGPTYVLRLQPMKEAPVPPEWTARLVETALPPGVAGELLVGELGLSLAPTEPDRGWTWQEPREGDLAWIRYPLLEHEADAELRPVLVVRAKGWLDIEVEAASTVGVHGPLLVPLAEEAGTVAGHVRDERGLPVGGATVLLRPIEAPSDGMTPVWERAFSGDDGSYAFERVAAGARRLVAFAHGHRAEAEPLVVRPGGSGRTRGDVTLARASAFYSLALRGRASGGEGHSRLYVRAGLAEASPYGWLFLESESYGPGTHVAATWPAGLYGVGQVCQGGAPRFRPYVFLADTPYVDSDVDVIPAAELVPIRFVATDARDGSELRGASVLCGPEGSVYLRDGDLEEGEPLRLPADAPFTWTVAAREHAPAHGDQGDVRVENGERVVRVSLRTGWGVSMFFRAGDPAALADEPGSLRHTAWDGLLAGPPLPGIEVLADDMPVGRSDANGALRLAMGGVPLRIALRCDGWRLVAVDRTGGALENRHVVWLARETH